MLWYKQDDTKMKTSLICLLLLAAVACTAPQAGEMPVEKRVGMAEKKLEEMVIEKRAVNRRKMIHKKREMNEKNLRMMEKEKREEMAELQEAKADGAKLEAAAGEDRQYPYSPCYGQCPNSDGVLSCFFDDCVSPADILYYYGYCECCVVTNISQCYSDDYYNYYYNY